MSPNQRRLASLAGAMSLAVSILAPVSALEPLAVPKSDVAQVLGPHRVLEDGHYELTLSDGTRLVTHGPDPMPASGSKDVAVTADRAPVCADEYAQHILYSSPLGAVSRFHEVREELRANVRKMNALLNQEAIESGGVEADYKVICAVDGAIEVTEFDSLGADYYTIVESARMAGFDDPKINYSIFFDFSGFALCGVGSYNDDESLTVDNLNNQGGGYAVTYEPCWDGRTPMHENGHNMGAVQPNAPYSTGSGAHCYEDSDVMCYTPDGGDKNQLESWLRCDDRTHFDCGHDTYFDAEPEPLEYLDSHWNIGSRLNRFIAFGSSVPPPPPTPQPEPGEVSFTRSCVVRECRFSRVLGDVDVNGWLWDFGDGTRSAKRDPVHTYPQAGTYDVTLTITDTDLVEHSKVKTVRVYDPDPDPSAPNSFSGDYQSGESGDAGEWHYFKIQVPGGVTSLTTSLWDTCGAYACPVALSSLCPVDCGADLDVYLKAGSRPTESSYDCISTGTRGLEYYSNQSCTVASPGEGFYYAGVKVVEGGGTFYSLYLDYDDTDGVDYFYYH